MQFKKSYTREFLKDFKLDENFDRKTHSSMFFQTALETMLLYIPIQIALHSVPL